MVTEAAPDSVVEAPVLPIEAGTPIQEAAPIEAAAPSPVIAEAPPVVEVPPLRPPLSVDPRLRREREELRQREAVVREQEQQRAFDSTVAQRQKELEETDGLAPERAYVIAKSEVSAGLRAYIAEETAKAQVEETTNKMLVASVISQRFGVPLVSLLEYTSPEAMIEAAEKGTAQSKIEARLAAVEKENAELKKKLVPAQNFGTGAVGASSAGLNEQALEKAVASGQIAMTPEISARLNRYWAQ